MSFTVNVRVETRMRLAVAAARIAYVACRIVTLTPAESQLVATRVAMRLTRYRINGGNWQRLVVR